jgi:CheY-like chemotaxis protein
LDSIKVLCVDEYVLMLMTVQHMFEFEGWLVETARDGKEARLKLASSERFDAIVLSEQLSGTDNLELLRSVRGMAHRRRTPVIMFASNSSVREAYAAGADAVLQKPDDIRLLTETVARCLYHKNWRETEGKNKRYVHRPGEYGWFACIESHDVYDRSGQHIAYLDADGRTLRNPRTRQIIARECGNQFYTAQGQLWGAVREPQLALRAAR